jgi:hypothetical protein
VVTLWRDGSEVEWGGLGGKKIFGYLDGVLGGGGIGIGAGAGTWRVSVVQALEELWHWGMGPLWEQKG